MNLDKQIEFMVEKIKMQEDVFRHVAKAKEYVAPYESVLASLKRLKELEDSNFIDMKLLWWKIQYTYYMWSISRKDIRFIWVLAKESAEDDPESIYEDGYKYHADEEMDNWY